MAGILLDVPVKVLRVSAAESMSDMASLVEGVEGLSVYMKCGGEEISYLMMVIWNLRILPEVSIESLSVEILA